MEYTTRMDDLIYERAQADEIDGSYSELLAFLNSPNFRTFGDGLTQIIRSKMPPDCRMTPQEYLKHCCEEKEISVASNSTLYNWFQKGLRPDKAEHRREAMFALAFALGLNVQETTDLFHRVYLDRAFNKRSYRELIYYHCLSRGSSYAHAQKLISLVSFDQNAIDATIRTEIISEQASGFTDDIDLLAYIHNRPHNFALSNVAAMAEYEKRWERARISVSLEMGFISPNDKESQKHFQERKRGAWDTTRLDALRNKDINSSAFDFEVITGRSITGGKGTKPLSFKNKYLPKEIAVNFPTSPNLGKNPSHDQLRKMIILLFSYWFWYQMRINEIVDAFDQYKDQLNALLEDVGYPPLYPGNPFDWLFLTCSFMDEPLNAFRDILDEVLGEEA